MGFGCNAAGVVSCRIIDSPREKLIATITNVFVPCNGRFPSLIALAAILTGGTVVGFEAKLKVTILVVLIVGLGVFITLAISWLLSQTLLRGKPSAFTLELPPYRRPKIGEVIVRSILDRAALVLARAVSIAAPAGGIIWIIANIQIGSEHLLTIFASGLQPFAQLMGLNGFILLAFILALPANELFLPLLIMSYMAGGSLAELDGLTTLHSLLVDQHHWTWLTIVCVMTFSLCHWPCGTTIYTIYQEQKNLKWTIVSVLLPTLVGVGLCIIINYTAKVLGFF